MAKKTGKYTITLENSPSVISFAAIGSKKESQGPLASYFDIVNEDSTFGEQSWEKAESRMQKDVVNKALAKAQLAPGDIDCIFAGDLLNQCTASSFGLREMGIPMFGIYSACASIAEGLTLASILVDSSTVARAAAITSSHFCSSERQFRFPLEYGGQRPPTSQWTATAAGALIVGQQSAPPYVRAVTIGCIEDMGVTDANNMGAAMAPAAAGTLERYFGDSCTNADNYDLILTGDLGLVGSQLMEELLQRKGYEIHNKHADCGLLIYNRERQDVHAGGSGAGCSASVLCSYILPSLRMGRVQNVLFIATGALLSTTSTQQKQSIPGIAHLVHLSNQAQS